MSLDVAAPAMLWAFLVVPLALILALLARRERRVAVASMIPWQAVLALPRPRPRRNPLDLEVLCAVLVASFAALALASPRLVWQDDAARRVVILVDDSLSLRAQVPEGGTRWQQLQTSFLRLQEAYPDAEATLYLTSSNTPLAVQQKLSSITLPTVASSQSLAPQLRQRVGRAAVETARENDATLLWLSDVPLGIADRRIEEIRVGGPVANRALLVASWTLAQPPTLFAGVANFSDKPATLAVEAEQGGKSILRQALSLPETGRLGLTLTLPATLDVQQPVTLQLVQDTPDALGEDDAILLPPLATKRCAIDSEALPRMGLALQAAGYLLAGSDTEAVMAATQAVPEAMPQALILLAAPKQADCGLLTLGQPVPIRDARATAMPDGLPQSCAQPLAGADVPQVQLPPGSRVWLEGVTADESTVPLVADWEWRGRRVVYIAALPKAWTSSAAFPTTVALMLARFVPQPPALPGPTESDTMRVFPSADDFPLLSAGAAPEREFPLTRLCILAAVLALLAPCWREYRRSRSRVPSSDMRQQA